MPEPLEQLRAKLGQKAAAVSRLLATEDGRLLLEALEAQFFNGRLLGSTPEQTAFNVGAREVVVYLRQLRDHANKER